ncbi:MAG: putative DNA binding domain-containing protein [Propionibacteriaceae bacterium]|jgi:ATP-dependent DNA helicase RecG|nr:putative DNA binding domain-containing protein [Propionibacteriaceae bacterium]
MSVARIEEVLRLPAEQAVESLLSLPESQWYDRKSARVSPRDLAVALVAMANAEGGYVAVGFHSGKAEPLNAAKLNDIRQAAIDFTYPTVRTRFHEIGWLDGSVAVVEIATGSAVHETAAGDVYLRVGDESRKLSFAQRRELDYDRGSEVFSATVLEGSSLADLEPGAAETYRWGIGASSVESMCSARDLVDEKGQLRVAAWLLFSKQPGAGFPNAHVRVLKYGSNERGAGSALSLLSGHDVRCEGRLTEQLEQASGLVEQWLPKRQALSASGKFGEQPMIPKSAWMEGLVNAIIHRSYSMQGDHIRVEVFPNRLEISSPGRFPSFADTSKPMTIMRYARNPRIARAMAELGYALELGEGIKRMFGWMRERGLQEPVYAQTSGHVILTLLADPAADATGLPKAAVTVLDLMRQAAVPLKTGEVSELAGCSRPTALRHLNVLKAAGLVVWNGESPRDPQATWNVV